MPIRDSTQIAKAKQELVRLFAKEEGFVGAGVASDKAGRLEIVVFVMDAKSGVVAKVPNEWKGFTVRTEVSGSPRKFDNP